MRRYVIMAIVVVAGVLLVVTVVRKPTRENTAQAADELSQSFGVQGASLACSKWTADGDGSAGSGDLLNDAARASDLAADYSRRWTVLDEDIDLYTQFPDPGLAQEITSLCGSVPAPPK